MSTGFYAHKLSEIRVWLTLRDHILGPAIRRR